jgi:phosphoglycerol transferase MdoB-like AlkP superfamily enzyme
MVVLQAVFIYIERNNVYSGGRISDDYSALLKAWLLCDVLLVLYKAARLEDRKGLNRGLVAVFFALAPVLTVLCMEPELVYALSYRILLYEVLCLLCVQLALYALSGSRTVSYLVVAVLYIALLSVNSRVTQYRGVPIQPQDIYSLATLLKVMGNYSFAPTAEELKGVITLVSVAVLLSFTDRGDKIRKLWRAVGGVVLAACCIAVVAVGVSLDSFTVNTFVPSAEVSANGLIVNLCRHMSALKISAPTSYNDKEAKALYKAVKSEQKANSADTAKSLPHIIVVMDESFADLSVLGEVDASEEYLHNYNELKSEAISGNMLVSAFGGNTANTEFEFLTGLSTAFLPEGSVAYNQYITRSIPSLASWLKSLGYRTEALHPFEAQSWNRELVYDKLGFDDFVSIEDMNPALKDGDRDKYTFFDLDGKAYGEQFEYVRSLLSDREDYKELIKLFEERSDDDRMLLFNVTIQNHGGYDVYTNGFVNEVKLKGREDKYTDVEQYLTLIKKSDEALWELVDYFRGVDEPVVLVFFGDHQPSLNEDFYTEVIKDKSELETDVAKHTVPYMIWSNKGVDKSKERAVISPNLLMPYLLKVAGVPTSSFMDSLSELNKSISAMNDRVYIDSEGNTVEYGEDYKTTQWYSFYQYYTMFDS